ncbi:MAG: hypothetical protein WBQ94_03335 [Terracidiphilus sp.]
MLSTAARSTVYLVAMMRANHSHTFLRAGLPVVLVEIVYVTLTAGVYAGLQQRALSFRSRFLGDLTVVFAVPVLAQVLDWLTHRAAGAPAPGKATLAVCVFATVSALFHLHVMRRGVFLSGHRGRSLLDDFRRIPRLIAGFVATPVLALAAMIGRFARSAESEAAS